MRSVSLWIRSMLIMGITAATDILVLSGTLLSIVEKREGSKTFSWVLGLYENRVPQNRTITHGIFHETIPKADAPTFPVVRSCHGRLRWRIPLFSEWPALGSFRATWGPETQKMDSALNWQEFLSSSGKCQKNHSCFQSRNGGSGSHGWIMESPWTWSCL